MQIHSYTYIHTHARIFVIYNMYMYIYIYICICIYIYDTVLSTHRRYVYRYILSLSSCRIRIFCSSDESIIHLYFSPLLISCFLPPFLLIRFYPLRIVRSCFPLYSLPRITRNNIPQESDKQSLFFPFFSVFLKNVRRHAIQNLLFISRSPFSIEAF